MAYLIIGERLLYVGRRQEGKGTNFPRNLLEMIYGAEFVRGLCVWAPADTNIDHTVCQRFLN